MVDRAVVYGVLDGERKYQDEKWNEKTTDSAGLHSVGEYLCFIYDYVQQAMSQMARNPEPEATNLALDTLRKITAMGVACMEQNGVRYRTVSDGKGGFKRYDGESK